MVLWPGLAQSDVSVLPTVWMLVASPLFAVSFLLSKVLTRYDRPEAIVFWLGVMIFSFGLPLRRLCIGMAVARGLAMADGAAMDRRRRLRPGRLVGALLHDAGLSHRGRLGRAVRAIP